MVYRYFGMGSIQSGDVGRLGSSNTLFEEECDLFAGSEELNVLAINIEVVDEDILSIHRVDIAVTF